MKLMKWYDKIEDGLIGGLLVLITLMVFFEVFCRFVLNSQWLSQLAIANGPGFAKTLVDFGRGVQVWIQEGTLYLSGWLVLLGASWAVREKAHICMDAVTSKVSPKVERIMTLIGLLLSLIYCCFFIYGSWIFLAKLKKIGLEMEDINLPKWIGEGVLVIGFVLLALRLIQLAIKVLKGEETSFFEHNHIAIEETAVEETK